MWWGHDMMHQVWWHAVETVNSKALIDSFINPSIHPFILFLSSSSLSALSLVCFCCLLCLKKDFKATLSVRNETPGVVPVRNGCRVKVLGEQREVDQVQCTAAMTAVLHCVHNPTHRHRHMRLPPHDTHHLQLQHLHSPHACTNAIDDQWRVQVKRCVHKLSKSQKVDLRKSPLKLWTRKRLKFN